MEARDKGVLKQKTFYRGTRFADKRKLRGKSSREVGMAGALIVIYIDVESGNLVKVTDERGEIIKPVPVTELTLGGQTIRSVPNFTVIGTASSPVCRWVFYNNQWYKRCTG